MAVTVVAAVLAAGRGERFLGDSPKPLALLHGRPLVAWAIDAALRSAVGSVAVVTGHGREQVERALPAGVVRLHNPTYAAGIATSVAIAAGWAQNNGASLLCIALADQPGLGPDAWSRVATACEQPGVVLAAATYGGRRGHPVAIAASLFDDARALTGDDGARVLMQRYPVVNVPCDGTGFPDDVDTLADLERVEALLTPRRPA